MKLLLILLFISTFTFAKKDFYYSFVDSNGNQISHKLKQEIIDGYTILEQVRELVKDGNVNAAYTRMKAFKEQNQLKVLKSDIILLYSDLLLKKKSKRFILEGTKLLEGAVNASLIHEEDLPKAYMLLVDLKIKSNKINDARFFAKNIINNFDNPTTKAYGNIYLAKIYTHTRDYNKSIKVLYDILAKTDDILIATIVADELFDVYIKSNKKEKAYELINKVLEKNIDYYANDSYLAIAKVNKLLLANMPEFAVEILKELIKRTTKPHIIEEFKYKLANTYMDMYEGSNYFLFKAKELYKDILNDFPSGQYVDKSKTILDEILMREGKVEPSVLGAKYSESSSMKQKVLMQELINQMKNGEYSQVLRAKKIYKKVSNTIAQRFGYKDIDEVFDEVSILLIRQYLNEGQCLLLNKALKDARKQTLVGLIEDEDTKYKFFECLIEVPYERGYKISKDAFYKSRDANIYYYLERMAYALGFIDEAFRFSLKLDMLKDEETMSKEFLIKFLVYSAKNDSIEMDRFFRYVVKNENLIQENETNPKIIDFYYQYYLYLLKMGKEEKANEILNKLNNKQIEFKAKVYSPFVELELSKIEKNNKEYPFAIDILEEYLNDTRRIRNNDLAHVYYELSKLYELTENGQKYEDVVFKCKDIKGAKESYYKKMCDKL